MTRIAHTRRRGWRAALAMTAIAAAMTLPPATSLAAEPNDMVLRWNANVVAALSNPGTAAIPGIGQPPPLASIHVAMAQTAVYDAINAIAGGYTPYLSGLPAAPSTASKAAAAAQAAHDVAVALTASSATVVASLDAQLAASLAEVTGAGKDAGIAIGRAAAAAMLLDRQNDGRTGTKTFEIGDDPGEWRLVPPLNANSFAFVGSVRPFALKSPDQLRVEPPLALTSPEYAAEFNEVKALGRQTGSTRNEAQESLAGFISANPLPFMSRGLREIAAARGMSPAQQARFLAMTNMASADALIGCWNNKDFYDVWRPQTAIQLAATDGNPATTADPNWKSVIPAPGYPDLPSGYNCLTAGMWYAVRLYFHTDFVSFSLTSPGVAAAPPNIPATLPGSTRSYTRTSHLIKDAINGRILNGLHFRHADEQGAWLGKKAAQWVEKHEFLPVD